jgi:hypothetical protein
MDILGFGTPELLLILSFVVIIAIIIYVVKAVRAGIAEAMKK